MVSRNEVWKLRCPKCKAIYNLMVDVGKEMETGSILIKPMVSQYCSMCGEKHTKALMDTLKEMMAGKKKGEGANAKAQDYFG
jgi:ssDNA-binding Zn-finger/Zn-ribbon topoisomerase 1